jgi:rhodanese-related sulfurtransferase
MKLGGWILVGMLALLAAGLFAGRGLLRLEWIKRQVRAQFPGVAQMSTAELARRLEAGEKPVLLDVRRFEEYAVSHLEGAIWLDPETEKPELPGVGRDTAIVTYCSIGWRSSQMAARLQEAGYRRVHNLEGSIFEWAREGRPLFQSGGDAVKAAETAAEKKVYRIHPYSPAWSFLVPPEKRAYLPEEAAAAPRP